MSPARDERPTGRSAARDPATKTRARSVRMAERARRVSAIVPVYNSAHMIEGCLRALDNQTLDAEDYEVICVDDGSADDTAARAEAFATGARARMVVIRQPVNKGPAAARNAGLAAASGPVIAFTDADCEVAPDWLEKALARLEADPAAAAVEGRTIPKGTVGTLTHQMINETGGLFMTCNMTYRREALGDGFDERFRLAFLEDSDVAFNALERGDAIVWDQEVLVEHLVLPEGRRKFNKEARKRFYNPLLFKKHRELYVKHLQPVVPGLPGLHLRYMGAVVVMLFFALSGIFIEGGLWGGFVLAGLGAAFYGKRVMHAYRARLTDPVSALQALIHPFVQTYWVICGAIHFRSFSFDI